MRSILSAVLLLTMSILFTTSSYALDAKPGKRLFQCSEKDRSDTIADTMYETNDGYILQRKMVLTGELLGELKLSKSEAHVTPLPKYAISFDTLKDSSNLKVHIVVKGLASSIKVMSPSIKLEIPKGVYCVL